VKIPERVIHIWLCGFLENNKCLHLGTPAVVTFCCYKLNPPPSEKGKVMRPSQEKVWGLLVKFMFAHPEYPSLDILIYVHLEYITEIKMN